jgi:hypothetical protein
MKSLSLVCGLLALGFLTDAIRRASGSAAAATGALLFGLSAVQIDQSTDAKGYAILAQFLALLLWAIVRGQRDPERRSFAVLSLLSAAALGATHFYGLAAIFATGAALFLSAGDRAGRRQAAAVILISGADAALFVPGVLRLPRGASDYIREIWAHVPRWAPAVVSTRISLPGWRKPYPPMDSTMLPQVSVREIVAGLVLVVLLAAGELSRKREPETPAARFLRLSGAALFFGFLGLETAAAFLDRPIGLPGRFEVVTEIGLALLAASSAARLVGGGRIFLVALSGVVLWTAIPQWQPHFGPKPLRREEVLVDQIRSRLLPNQSAEIVTLGLARPPFDYYSAGDPRIRMISFPASQNEHPGWRASAPTDPESAALRKEAEGLLALLDSEMARGVRVFVAARPDPRNQYLMPLLERDHELIRSPLASWFFEVAPATPRLAGNISSVRVSHLPKEAIWDAESLSPSGC